MHEVSGNKRRSGLGESYGSPLQETGTENTQLYRRFPVCLLFLQRSENSHLSIPDRTRTTMDAKFYPCSGLFYKTAMAFASNLHTAYLF